MTSVHHRVTKHGAVRLADEAFEPQALADDLDEVCGIYARVFASLDTTTWDTPSRRGPKEWTLHETIAHLCALNGAGLESITHALHGEPYTFRGLESRYQLDTYNRHGIDEHLGEPPDALFAEFLRVHGRAADLARTLSHDQAELTVSMPIYNRPVQIAEALGIIVMHAGLVHTAQVAEPAGVPPLWTQLPPEVRHRQIERVMRAFSLLYRRDIGGSLRAALAFHVDGHGGGDWHVDLSPEAASSGEGVAESPALTLRFRETDDFCRMLTGRLNVPLALIRGDLKVRGDARLFLRMNRFFSVDARPEAAVPTMDAFREGALRRSVRQAVTIGRAVRAARARVKAAPPHSPEVDGVALRELLAEVGTDAQLVRVPANRCRWTTTGVQCQVGEQVTWLAWGRAYVVKLLGVGVWPRFALGGRVSGGAVQQSGRDTFTFTADRDGQLELASLFPGEVRADGSIASDRIPYRALTGGFTAVVVRWARATDPRASLEAIADRDRSGLCAAEAARLADPPKPPAGWDHHPLLRPAETYTLSERGIAADVRDAVGIVRRPVDVPLTSTLRLRWTWRLDALPSKLPEDTTLTHDYLSVALEFDDGQDLTWYWSCALPRGFTYRCPFEHWRRRETHVVVRSGTADLGRWVDEERPVLADHQVAIGGLAPARVIRAWLISCSFLQGNEGRGEFARIELVDGNEITRVL